MSLQQACAAQVATSQTLGLAIGAVMGSTSLSYDSSFLQHFSASLTIKGNGWNSDQRPAGREIWIPGAFDLLWSESPGRGCPPCYRSVGAESEFVCYCLERQF